MARFRIEIIFRLSFFFSLMMVFLINLHVVNAAPSVSSGLALSTDVQPSLLMDVSRDSYNFGLATAGTPTWGPGDSIIYITTNSANGYTVDIKDMVPGNNSALLHSDNSTRIPDFPADIENPQTWSYGVSKGVGFSIFKADTNKEAKWGTGTTYNSVDNKYAGIVEIDNAIHTSPGFKTTTDNTWITFVLDVEADQKNGSYSGSVTLSATANLS